MEPIEFKYNELMGKKIIKTLRNSKYNRYLNFNIYLPLLVFVLWWNEIFEANTSVNEENGILREISVESQKVELQDSVMKTKRRIK